MKFTIVSSPAASLLFSSILSSALFHHTSAVELATTASSVRKLSNDPGLGEFYIESLSGITEEPTSSDIVQIKLPFNTSNRDRGALVYQSDCITPFPSNDYFEASLSTAVSTVDDGFIQFNTTLDMNVTALNETGTPYFNAFSDGTRGGWAEACVETYLNLTIDGEEEKINFVNNLLNISIELSADFSVEDVVVSREPVESTTVETDYTDFVEAYECAIADPYTAISSGTNTYNQGDVLTICVKDTEGGVVQVKDVIDLTISQTGTDNYNYIVDRLYNNDITTKTCIEGSSAAEGDVCIVEMVLISRFFSTLTPPDLVISGSVDVVRGDYTVRRGLRMKELAAAAAAEKDDGADHGVAHRRTQVDDDEGTGGFNLNVNLSGNEADDSAASDYFKTTSGVVAMAVGAAGAAILV